MKDRRSSSEVLKGFSDVFRCPIPKEAIVTTLQRHFASYGLLHRYPALEYGNPPRKGGGNG